MNTINVLELLRQFATQRPSLDFSNYGDVRAYRAESREITKDLHDFRELFSFAFSRVDNLNELVYKHLVNSSGQLSLKDGKLLYITGQYFPTEYRPAANRVLRDIIWQSYSNEVDNKGNHVYQTGHDIRKAIARRVSRRVMRNYFN